MDSTTPPRGLSILAEAQHYYQQLAGFRADRERNKRYNYGDQWSDRITVDGRTLTEARYIAEQGHVPLKNNLIRRLVRNVIGVYSAQCNRPTCLARDPAEQPAAQTLNALLHYNMQLNRMTALYSRSMEEFLISGMVVHRKSYGRRGNRTDCWTDFVQPSCFFVDNRMRDFRGWDCSCVGEIHDVSWQELVREFGTDCTMMDILQACYGAQAWQPSVVWRDFGMPSKPDRDFLCPSSPGLCRVIEVWRKELRRVYICHDRRSGKVLRTTDAALASGEVKWSNEEVWRFYYITPQGEILAQGDSPYAHGSHPYVMKAYPMIDGEIHSFVSDVIDQQRYTNRLISLYDWIMHGSAKGVLMVPEECVPRGASPTELVDAWNKYNGVIFYRHSPQGAEPHQVAMNATNIGIRELLDLQLNFFQDISGVNSAIQGKVPNVAVSAELYGQQTQNATTTLLDLMDTFSEFVRDAAYKDVKNIRQFYSPERIRRIAGADCTAEGLDDVEFDLSIAPNTSTPAFRQASNDMLFEIWKSGQITLEQMLRAGSFPFADSLLAQANESNESNK